MTEIWELERHVDSHQQDHAQRWRLAKKLYATGQYKKAVPHLVQLREEWTPKLNVMRYLAASYYRLKQFDDSIETLEDALRFWPEEMALREQLACVLEAAKRPKEALGVWRGLMARFPEFTAAQENVKRLEDGAPTGTGANIDWSVIEKSSPTDSGLMRICGHCGTDNDPSAARCAQCRAWIDLERTRFARTGRAAPSVVYLIILSCLGASSYSFWYWFWQRGTLTKSAVSYEGALRMTLLEGHMLSACLLLVSCPILLFMAARLINLPRLPRGLTITTGLLLGSAGMAATCVPGWGFVILCALMPAVAYIILKKRFGFSGKQTVQLWASQGFLVLIVACVGIFAAEGSGPFKALPAIVRHGLTLSHVPGGRFTVEEIGNGTLNVPIEWKSTGNPWLDKAIGHAKITAVCKPGDHPISLALQDDQKTYSYTKGDSDSTHLFTRVTAARPFMIVAKTDERATTELRVWSLLEPGVQE